MYVFMSHLYCRGSAFGEDLVAETVVAALSYDYVVNQGKTTGLESILKCPCLADVFRTWEGVSRRMIVYEYDTGGLSFYSPSDYHPIIDYCRVFAAAAEAVFPQK